ncbi:hypothetical protein AAFN46_05395 [Pseudomonas sp. CAU 1711]|uniref:hypothetical protein n=1 Tax=Pseudomonas sp. CAU 1711 TaxID=3140356 RepID=UPI0032606B98
MKTLIATTTLATLLTGFGAVPAHASEASPFWSDQHARLMLAEGGSERLIVNRQRIQESLAARDRLDDSQRFADLIEEQPTAAGTREDARETPSGTSVPSYKSPILRDRAIYGSPH